MGLASRGLPGFGWEKAKNLLHPGAMRVIWGYNRVILEVILGLYRGYIRVI